MKVVEYAKFREASDEVIDFLERTTKTKSLAESEYEHVVDYLVSDDAPRRLKRASWEQMVTNANKWTKKMSKLGKDIVETDEDVEVVLDFNDGFKIVKLVGKSAYEREGFLMRHCVADYYGRDVNIYSLRDKRNMPHCTIEEDMQIKGKGNGSIHPKYIAYVVSFLEHSGMEVRDCEMKNLGYVNVGVISDLINNKLFKDKYWYTNEDLDFIDKSTKYHLGNVTIEEYEKLDEGTILIGDVRS